MSAEAVLPQPESGGSLLRSRSEPPDSGLSSPAALRRLIEEAGHAFAVIEEAIGVLRGRMRALAPGDEDVVWVLRAHLLAIGSPSDASKYFSLELLERLAPERAIRTYVEVVELLARSPIQPERAYPVERAMIRLLADKQVTAALPALAVLAGREVYPLSRTAARAVAAIVGSTDQEAITDRLKRGDLPEASAPDALSEGVSRALWPQKRTTARSSQERRRALTLKNAAEAPAISASCLRPEGARARQQRLRGVLTGAGRDPARCGNCDVAGPTRIGHVVPPARGGTDRPGNLVALCAACRRRLPRRLRDGFDQGRAAPGPGGQAPQLTLF